MAYIYPGSMFEAGAGALPSSETSFVTMEDEPRTAPTAQPETPGWKLLRDLFSRQAPTRFQQMPSPPGAPTTPVAAAPASLIDREAVMKGLFPGWGGTDKFSMGVSGGGDGGATRGLADLLKMQKDLYAKEAARVAPTLETSNLASRFRDLQGTTPRPERESLQGSWGQNALARMGDVNFWTGMAGKGRGEDILSGVKAYEQGADVRHERDLAKRADTIDMGLKALGFSEKDLSSRNMSAKEKAEFEDKKFATLTGMLGNQGTLLAQMGTLGQGAARLKLEQDRQGMEKYADVRKLQQLQGIKSAIEEAQKKGDVASVKYFTDIANTMWKPTPVPPNEYVKELEKTLGTSVAGRLADVSLDVGDLARLKTGDTRFRTIPGPNGTTVLEWSK